MNGPAGVVDLLEELLRRAREVDPAAAEPALRAAYAQLFAAPLRGLTALPDGRPALVLGDGSWLALGPAPEAPAGRHPAAIPITGVGLAGGYPGAPRGSLETPDAVRIGGPPR